MADKEDVPEVQVVPVRSGSVTTLDGTRITSYGAGDQPTPPIGTPPATGYPVVMPQPSVIVVTVDRKADDKKPKKGYSDVFKRP
ncbi:MAG TPA: hypothetical protein VMD53_19050 [Rhizomicrobium sp.]|nr:hypothetical protein [Rhizomicrobium sp.]